MTTLSAPVVIGGGLSSSQRLVALVGFARNGMRAGLAYRADLAVALISQLLQVTLLMVVWRSVYGDSTEVVGISKQQAVSYAVLASAMQTMMMPWQFSSLPQRIRMGQVGVDLTRPVGMIGQVLAQNVGTMASRLPIVVAGVGWALLIGALSVPPGAATLGLWAISALLGLGLSLVLNLLMSMLAFWTLEISGWMMLYRFGSAVLSGALIPLWFMPTWLRAILEWLPFQGQMFTPLSIWFGTVSPGHAWRLVAVQALWLSAAAAIVGMVWRRAQHKVVVQGG